MIINNTYFFGDIYIAHAKPGISDPVTNVDAKIVDFINKYAEECMLRCLGHQLFNDLKINLDPNESSWVDALADDKWDELVNGKEYTDPESGLDISWKGIRFQAEFEDTKYYSFLANYVFYFYKKRDWINNGELGSQIDSTENSEAIPPTREAVDAWNKFIDLVQGEYNSQDVVYREGIGYGVDYFSGCQNISLYKFINDMNFISENTYANFNPKKWRRMDYFNLV